MNTNCSIEPDTWAIALRGLMGYPPTNPTPPTLTVAIGGSLDRGGVARHCAIARDLDQHMLRIELAEDGIPRAIQLAIRGDDKVTWYAPCAPYAATDTAPIEILTSIERWRIGEGLTLMASHLPTVIDRMAGLERAMRRWEAAAAARGPVQLDGTVFVPPGKLHSDGVPVARRHAA